MSYAVVSLLSFPPDPGKDEGGGIPPASKAGASMQEQDSFLGTK